MASPNHPNQLALGQQVLFYYVSPNDISSMWQEGTVHRARTTFLTRHYDHYAERHVQEEGLRPTHEEGCDQIYYSVVVTGEEHYAITDLCSCDVRIVDADATGRWHRQVLADQQELALLLTDAARLGDRIDTEVRKDPVSGDMIDFLVTPAAGGRPAFCQAQVRLVDLISWGTGLKVAWKEDAQ